jgi:hypothetical protein
MTLHAALAVSALAAALLLLVSAQGKALAGLALVAAGIEVAMALGFLHVSVAQLPVGLVLGLALALPGLVAWFRSSAKTAISAAAVVSFVGVLQVVVYALR